MGPIFDKKKHDHIIFYMTLTATRHPNNNTLQINITCKKHCLTIQIKQQKTKWDVDECVGRLVDARLGWVNECLKVLEEVWLVVVIIVY
jgi:hypothetical protein